MLSIVIVGYILILTRRQFAKMLLNISDNVDIKLIFDHVHGFRNITPLMGSGVWKLLLNLQIT